MPRGIAKPLTANGQAIIKALTLWFLKLDDTDVQLEMTPSNKKVGIIHKNVHVIDIEMTWSKERFLVQFKDRWGVKTQSIMGLDTADDVKAFAKLYAILLKHRAYNRT